MPTYRKGDEEANAIVKAIIKKYHTPLQRAGVTVTVLFAYPTYNDAGVATGPAITHEGYPAAAMVKKNSLKDRVEGKDDATITVDGELWKDATDEWKRAVIDHELQHLEVRLEDEGNADSFKTDDANRPVLKIRRHDWQIGGFEAIVQRHQAEALEYRQVIDVNRRFTQREFNWG